MSWVAAATLAVGAYSTYSSNKTAKSLNKPSGELTRFGRDLLGSGDKLSEEGLAGLRDDLKLFDDRLRNPLGDETEGIFRRARGQISDRSVRGRRAFAARLAERARQSGGTLSPAAVAELEADNARDLGEFEFDADFNLSREHAAQSLAETNRLFDRRAQIRSTILGFGASKSASGLQALIAALGGKNAAAAIAAQGNRAFTGSALTAIDYWSERQRAANAPSTTNPATNPATTPAKPIGEKGSG